MNFVDLMADHDWSEAEIVERMEAIIRARYTPSEQLILHRKLLGAVMGMYTLTPAEQGEAQAYAQVCAEAQAAGRAAREDMALLRQAWAVERGGLTEDIPSSVAQLVALRGRMEDLDAATDDPADPADPAAPSGS